MTYKEIVLGLCVDQTWKVVRRFPTPEGPFEVGDELKLISPTWDNPFCYPDLEIEGVKVPNWIVQAKNGETVWVGIPSLIKRGYLEKVI